MDSILFWLVPFASVLALCFALYFHKQMMKESEGTPQMIKIAAAVRRGAMSYLKQQYKNRYILCILHDAPPLKSPIQQLVRYLTIILVNITINVNVFIFI